MPTYLLIALALLALIWGFVFFRRSGLVGGCLATIGAGSCFGHPFFHVSVITLDRVLLALVAGLYFAHSSLFRPRPKPLSKSDLGLLAFLSVLLVNTISHDWKLDGAQPLATLLFFYLMPLLVYWITARCELTETSHKWIMGTIAAFGIYLSLTAICEVLSITALVFPRYIASSEHAEFLGRARGPYLNPVGNGMYLTAAFIAALLLWPYVRRSHRPVVLAVAGLHCVGLICTMTRSVWLGVAAALVGLATMCVPKEHRLRVLLVAGILGGAVLFVAGGKLNKFKRDINVSAEQMAESAALRPILAALAYEMFLDHPLTGVGFGQYRQRNADYLTRRSFNLPMAKAKEYVQHNVFFSLLAETGLLGVLAFVAVLGFWITDGWQLWYASELPLWRRQFGLLSVLLLTAYLPNAMFHELSLIPMLNMLVFFIAGLSRGQRDTRGVGFQLAE